jgi:hypothetical protein
MKSSLLAYTTAFATHRDITWSFSFILTAANISTYSGGFCTFLYNGDNIPTNIGIRDSLSYTPWNSGGGSVFNGISGSILGIGFDTTGKFGDNSNGKTTGLSAAIPNSISIREGSAFTFLTCLPVSNFSNLYTLTTAPVYQQLRFRLTDIGRAIEVSKFNSSTLVYDTLFTKQLNSSVTISASSAVIGISYCSPVTGEEDATADFRIRNFHCEGNLEVSNETFQLLQTEGGITLQTESGVNLAVDLATE